LQSSAKAQSVLEPLTSNPKPHIGQAIVRVDPHYFRPTEVDTLLGDASKARKKLGWKPRIGFHELVAEMVAADLKEAGRDQLCDNAGFQIYNLVE